MNYLLDTHVFLWFIGAPEKLSSEAIDSIRNPRNAVFVSAVTAIEIAIKTALGKLKAPADLEDEIAARGFSHLPVHYRHGAALQSLSLHHQDPFDRLLICQAMTEKLTLVSHDRKFDAYGVDILWT